MSIGEAYIKIKTNKETVKIRKSLAPIAFAVREIRGGGLPDICIG